MGVLVTTLIKHFDLNVLFFLLKQKKLLIALLALNKSHLPEQNKKFKKADNSLARGIGNLQ